MTETITQTEANELIKESKGRIFAATFIKKDLSIRVMNARTGKKYTPTGKQAPFKPSDYSLISVYDMKQKGFRMINLNTLTNLTINNIKYLIK